MTAIPPRLRARLQDSALAAFAALGHIQGIRQVRADGGLTGLGEAGLWGLLALVTATGLVLVVRRRWPVAVLLVVGAGSVVFYAFSYADGPGWLAPFVAVYTVAAYGDGRRSLWIAATGIAVLAVGWLVTADLPDRLAAGWVFFRIGTAVIAAALGESVRMRRVLAAEAQLRAERAEQASQEEARRRVDAERLRIAREVHDTVAHAIAIINVQAGVTAHVLNRRPQQARETLVTIEETSARALRELRATLGVLRDVDDDGCAPAPSLAHLDELTQRARDAGLDLKVEVPAPGRELPSAVDSAAYRIVQESLTNAIRHAAPTRVTVSLGYGPDELRIRVADDGREPCAPAPASGAAAGTGGGRGIAGMRERCQLLGGDLAAGHREGGGFEVRARLPLSPESTVPA